MPLFTARARPRLTRLSTSSASFLKKKERQLYMYLYILAVALLLVVSVSVLQLGLGENPADTPHDAKKGARGTEDLRVNRHKGEYRAAVRRENYRDTEKASSRNRAEKFNSGNLSKDWKARGGAGKKGFGNGWTEVEDEVGSKKRGVHDLSDYEEREDDLYDTDDLEEQDHTENSRMYQGQQLDDMDKFDRDEVSEDAYKQQGQLLDDMDRFDNRQVTEDTNRPVFRDDAVPKFVDSQNRKYHVVGKNHPQSQAREKYLMTEDDKREHRRDGKKESRKLGYRGETGGDLLNSEKEDEEQVDFGKRGHSIGDPSISDDRAQPANAVKQTPEAPEVSLRSAVEQEMEKRNSVSTKEARDFLRRSLGETIINSTSSHVKNNSAEGMPPVRGFKAFSDDMKVSHDNDSKPVDINVVRKDLKSEDELILDKDSSQGRKLPPWGTQMKEEDVIVDSLNLPNVKDKKVNNNQLPQGSAQETAGINKLDFMKLNTSITVERTSMNTRFDDVVNSKLDVEVSKTQEHSDSADQQETDKQLIKEDQLANVENTRNEGEKEMESVNADEGDPPVEENEVEGEPESKKTVENDSAVEENEDKDHDHLIQWGFYPTLSTTLKFSKFLSAFFKQESCSLRIFMAWTTAPWAYTPRHQRAIESILHFHPKACIVVFTETIDFEFFESWVKEGYKIAVARPNLEELLGKTPAVDFAYVWYEWRNMNLFYIHYTELLRIAALHKYGGVWLDMDMILARPLPKQHNVLGSTVAEDGEWVLNGAYMSFDKSSSFLKACIEEYVATYDETSLGWNGADLLNRVASNATQKGGKVWLEQPEHLQVLEPILFFPLSQHNILRYFSAPKNNDERVEQKKMLLEILHESHGTHLWNSVTGRHVPEVGSLVEKLLNQNCMRCTDVL